MEGGRGGWTGSWTRAWIKSFNPGLSQVQRNVVGTSLGAGVRRRENTQICLGSIEKKRELSKGDKCF